MGTSYGLENFHHYHFLTDPWQKSVLTELWIVLREEGNRSIILLLPPLLHSQATSTLYKLPAAAILYGITLHSGTLRWLYTTWIYFGEGIVSLLLPPPTNTNYVVYRHYKRSINPIKQQLRWILLALLATKCKLEFFLYLTVKIRVITRLCAQLVWLFSSLARDPPFKEQKCAEIFATLAI